MWWPGIWEPGFGPIPLGARNKKNKKKMTLWQKQKKTKFSDTMAGRGVDGIVSGNLVFFGSAIVSENFVFGIFWFWGFVFCGFWVFWPTPGQGSGPWPWPYA